MDQCSQEEEEEEYRCVRIFMCIAEEFFLDGDRDWSDERTLTDSSECPQESMMITSVYLVAGHLEMDNASTID